MSGDGNGVVVYRATRLTMIEAVRSAHPAPAGRLRRNKRLTHAELADAILATLPEAEPDPLNSPEPDSSIIEAANATIAELRGRCDTLFASNRSLREEDVRKAVTIADLRKGIDEGADLRLAISEVLNGVPGLSQANGGDLAADVQELADRCAGVEAGNVILREAAEELRADRDRARELVADLRGRRAKLIGELADATVRADRAEAENVTLREALAGYAPDPRLDAMTAALERFAAPGAITATDRRKAASEALGTAEGAS